jgi:hypothetical protein
MAIVYLMAMLHARAKEQNQGDREFLANLDEVQVQGVKKKWNELCIHGTAAARFDGAIYRSGP